MSQQRILTSQVGRYSTTFDVRLSSITVSFVNEVLLKVFRANFVNHERCRRAEMATRMMHCCAWGQLHAETVLLDENFSWYNSIDEIQLKQIDFWHLERENVQRACERFHFWNWITLKRPLTSPNTCSSIMNVTSARSLIRRNYAAIFRRPMTLCPGSRASSIWGHCGCTLFWERHLDSLRYLE